MIVNDRNIASLMSGTAHTLDQIGAFFNRTDRKSLGMQFINMSRSLDNAVVMIIKEKRSESIEQRRQTFIEQREEQNEKFRFKPVTTVLSFEEME